MAYPDEDRAANVLVQLSERILLKALTSPLNLHLSISNNILMSLLESTDFEYHSKIASALMKMIEALYLELKNMKQEQKIVNVSIDVREEQLGMRNVLTQNIMAKF